jgi:hypothetical protein
MDKRKKFEAIAATTKSGMPTGKQLADNGIMPNTPPAGKYKSTMHEYSSDRPKRQVMTRNK